MKKKIEWHIEKKKLSELNPYEHNPRKLTEKGMADLKRSIDKFGLAEPIIINLDNTIIGGHARFFTLLKNNDNDNAVLDCYVPNIMLTPKEVQELNIRLNKNIAGEFDLEVLADAFKFDDLLEWGFESDELDASEWGEQKTDEELDDVPEPKKNAVSKLGDIFLLDGKHRVMCGDSTKREDVANLMDGKKADMCFTDPPFNISYQDLKHRHKKIANDKMDENDFDGFLTLIYNVIPENSYVCCNWQSYPPFFNIARLSNKPVKSCIVWDKKIPAQNLDKYYKRHEFILYHGKFGGQKTLRGDVIELKRQRSKLHPTVKPIELVEIFIEDGSYLGDYVLDLFLGSGSTLIACEQTNRICYGMEIDPIYVDVILRRYYNLYPEKKIECLTRKDFKLSDLFNDA